MCGSSASCGALYFARKRKVTTKHLREFSARYFGPFGGYAQQYLFHHARTTHAARKKIQMKFDAALTPADISRLPERDLSATTCVVFDVLRATSSMITALANGAAEIFPAKTIEEARALREKMPDALLGGERHGERIEGFDLGNNPFEYIAALRRDNGSSARRRTAPSRSAPASTPGRVLVGALLNIAALRDELARSQPAEVLLVCAGTFETFALEDAIAAGLLAAEFPDAELTDAAVRRGSLRQSGFSPRPSTGCSPRATAARSRHGAGRIRSSGALNSRVLAVIGAMDGTIIRRL